MPLQEKLEQLRQQAWYQRAPQSEQRELEKRVASSYQTKTQQRAGALSEQYADVAQQRAGGASPADLAQARADAVRSTVALRRDAQAQQTNPLARFATSVASPLVAGAAGYADMGTFGNAAQLAS